MIAVVAAIGAVVSMLLPLSYDEAYWLAISRMWGGGGTLYESALDNKSPLVYLLYGVIDHLPGSFQIARGVLLGALVMIAGSIARCALGERERSRPLETSKIAGLLVGILLLGEFKLFTEVIAAPLIVGALYAGMRGRAVASAMLGVLATFFTPLAAGVVLVALWIARDAGAKDLRAAVGLTATVFFAVAVALFSLDNLRFGMVEVSLASRRTLGTVTLGFPTGERLLFISIGALPLLAAGQLLGWQRRSWLRIAMAAALPLAAGWYLHYWIAPTATGLVLPSGEGMTPKRRHLVLWSVVPLAVLSSLLIHNSRDTAQVYERVTSRLEMLADSEWKFVQFDSQPYVTARFPERALLRGPTIHYLIWETSRSSSHRGELRGLLEEADLMLAPKFDQSSGIPMSMAFLAPDFIAAIQSYDCAIEFGHLIAHMRINLCETWASLEW